MGCKVKGLNVTGFREKIIPFKTNDNVLWTYFRDLSESCAQIWLKFEDRIITSIRSYQSKISKPEDYDAMKRLLNGFGAALRRLNLETISITSLQIQLRDQYHEVLLFKYSEIFDAIIEKDNFTPLLVSSQAEELEIYSLFPYNKGSDQTAINVIK